MRKNLILTLTLAVLFTPTGPSALCQEMAPAMPCCPPSAPCDLNMDAPSCCRVTGADATHGVTAQPPSGSRADDLSKVILMSIFTQPFADAIGTPRIAGFSNLRVLHPSVPLFLLNASILR